ncbi:NAD-dependent protein deacetylase, SIR2 family [Oleiphilus messinensis]|uniref:protein acetyllysine N-acetyltransferase n=1 Tax=Oleiphilus messinensis TaxID=141451 RepID=A0A1Y0I878_9GAMM|nr:Sir2 family NAD-dependent protein deacetylase [Oleiphilus messinensis]ARU56698.1 NAD-dependent protein deacetylase, SIR2 family [Oleiphilus messinensis]
MRESKIQKAIERAADSIARAESILIGAGAGMGVDSGLPDFRGQEGFWNAYPKLARQNVSFEEMANPKWFAASPKLAWGFYGHRFNLYRTVTPHPGFKLLKEWQDCLNKDAFVFTSNVDGQFQKAGFEEHCIYECHGSIHHWQCSNDCSGQIWTAPDNALEIDEEQLELVSSLPRCKECGAVARPNILMFGDWDWNAKRAEKQSFHYQNWQIQKFEKCKKAEQKSVTIELGAGTAVPTVRYECEQKRRDNILIRVNPRESQVPVENSISIPLGALDALSAIDDLLR